MHPRADTAADVSRFTRTQRWIHRTTAALMGVCVLTAACLYVPQLAELVGRRALIVTLHKWSGLALPLPVLAGLASRAFRADLGRLNRFGPHDRTWLRAALHRDKRHASRPAAKFNAGQKIYASWIAGATLVMLATGLMMWFTHLTPCSGAPAQPSSTTGWPSPSASSWPATSAWPWPIRSPAEACERAR